MYVCMYVRMQVCMYVCMHEIMYILQFIYAYMNYLLIMTDLSSHSRFTGVLVVLLPHS